MCHINGSLEPGAVLYKGAEIVSDVSTDLSLLATPRSLGQDYCSSGTRSLRLYSYLCYNLSF